MAEPSARPGVAPPEGGSESTTYRPLSVLAIVGCALGVFYAGTVLIGGVSSFTAGTPLLLPTVLCVFLPLAGAGLSFAARRQIVRSEGTRAGLALTQWGWWLSIIFGLGYAAFYAATYLALRSQADVNAEKYFFEKLKQGKTHAAFWYTLDPSTRQTVNPDNHAEMEIRFNVKNPMDLTKQGQFTVFQQSELVRTIVLGGAETQVKALGVQEWDYNTGAYVLKRNYLITTPEGEFEAIVGVSGSTSRGAASEGRQWRVVLESTGIQQRRLTDRGNHVLALRQQSIGFLRRWSERMLTGNYEEAFLDLCEPAERSKLRAVFRARYVLLDHLPPGLAQGPLLSKAMALGDPELILRLYMPNYERVLGKLVEVPASFDAEDEATKEAVKKLVRNPFRARAEGFPLADVSLWEPNSGSFMAPLVKEGRIRFKHECQLAFPPRYRCGTTIVVESEPGFEDAARETDWRLLRIVASDGEDKSHDAQAARMKQMQGAGGPPGPGMMRPPPGKPKGKAGP